MPDKAHADASSISVPEIGFGTYGLKGAVAEQAVLDALDLGYRHIDTAGIYDNFDCVGRAMRDSGVPRSEIFITSKIWGDHYKKGKFEEATAQALELMQTDYIDLLMLNWPPSAKEFDSVFELLLAARDSGHAKYIGISNFDGPMLEQALKQIKGIACHQIEMHPYIDQESVIKICNENQVHLNAYYALARGKIINEPVIQEIANKLETPPSAVALRWVIDRGLSVSTTSSKRFHLKDNLEYRNIKLDKKQKQRIDNMVRPNGSVMSE